MELGPAWSNSGLVGLFLACFLAATVLPFSSESVLAVMALGPWSSGVLWLVASLANSLGGMSSYGLGRLGDPERIARQLRIDMHKARCWHHRIARHGPWAALLTWLPFVGDLIAIALGIGRAPVWPVALLMFVGKAARYAVVLALLRA
jgi:membrane protein YqaA with SNARE-associated domain